MKAQYEQEGEWVDIMSETKNGKATASLVLGIIGLVAWFFPGIGLPVTIIGLVLGLKAVKLYTNQAFAIVGIILNSFGLAASILNAALGVYLAW